MRIFLTCLENVLFVLNIAVILYGLYFLVMGVMCVFFKPKKVENSKQNRFALVVAARNERDVIGNLVESLTQLNYPKDLYDIVVVPNNCTDDTEAVAAAAGAQIYHCEQPVHMKADALSQVFDHLLKSGRGYDAFCVFDADNLVDPEFLTHMNNSLNGGARIAQGFRDAKNPHDSWISMAYSIYYYCVNSFMNRARTGVGMSAYINGTGFMVSADLVRQIGFQTYTLTEDNEYSIQCIINGDKVEYVPGAIIYDEHPIRFWDSWKQRLRWSKGLIDCCGRYTKSLLHGAAAERKLSALDALLFTFGPILQVFALGLAALTILCVALAKIITPYVFFLQDIWIFAVCIMGFGLIFPSLLAALACYSNGKSLSSMRGALVAFPLFLLTWAPINIVALFDKSKTWEPIKHTRAMSLSELNKE